MIDEIRVWVCLADEPEAIQRLARAPAYADSSGEADQRGRVRAEYRGFRWDYYLATKKLVGRGSLHSFAQGDNTGRFTAGEVAEACTDLAAAVDLPPERLCVRGLEAGLNLPLAKSPRTFLEALSSHKKAPFTAMNPPAKATRPLLYNAHHTDYRLKFYDKGEYSRLQGRTLPDGGPPHLMRFELEYRRARPLLALTGRPALTLADLPRPEVLQAVGADLLKHWNLTQREQAMNYDGLNLVDSALLRLANDASFWDAMRKAQPRRTYERKRGRARALLVERNQPHPYDGAVAAELGKVLGDLG